MLRKTVLAMLIMAVAGCAWSPAPRGRLGRTLSPHQLAACSAQGGHAAITGFYGESCVHPYADGGQACTDGGQCRGACVWDKVPPQPPADPLTAVGLTGRCQADDAPLCAATLEAGRLSGRDVCE